MTNAGACLPFNIWQGSAIEVAWISGHAATAADAHV